eukprot:jgi/Botrbrau1/16954/Bobra.49_2s0018.1
MQSRGQHLKGVPEADLFSGRVWTGRQAAQLGIVDEVSDMRSALTAKFGPQVVLNLCSESPRGTLSDALGLRGFAAGLGYQVTRGAADGLMDELETRLLYSRLGV